MTNCKRKRLQCDGAAKKYTMQANVPAKKATANRKEKTPERLAIFVSGGGSNFKAIHEKVMDGTIKADIALCISSKQDCPAWHYARSFDIPTVQWPKDGCDRQTSAKEVLHILEHTYKIDFVILAGFVKLVPHMVVRRYHRAMLNIHPTLLPAFGGKGFYGNNAHNAVVASGVKFTGPTVHFVDENLDTGPILAQRVVSVGPNDSPETVAARVVSKSGRSAGRKTYLVEKRWCALYLK